MTTYNPATKFHPPVPTHCNAQVNAQLFAYNDHLLARTQKRLGKAPPAGSVVSAVTAATAVFSPSDLPRMQQTHQAQRVANLLEDMLESPFISAPHSTGFAVEAPAGASPAPEGGGNAREPAGNQRPPVPKKKPRHSRSRSKAVRVALASLPCLHTVYKSDFITPETKIRSFPTELRQEGWGDPSTEALSTVYRSDFRGGPPDRTMQIQPSSIYTLPRGQDPTPLLGMPSAFAPEAPPWGLLGAEKWGKSDLLHQSTYGASYRGGERRLHDITLPHFSPGERTSLPLLTPPESQAHGSRPFSTPCAGARECLSRSVPRTLTVPPDVALTRTPSGSVLGRARPQTRPDPRDIRTHRREAPEFQTEAR
eukprot:RCo005448